LPPKWSIDLDQQATTSRIVSHLMRPRLPLILSAALVAAAADAALFDFAETGGSSPDNSQGAAGNVQVVDATQAALVATVNGIKLTQTAVSSSGTPTLGANDQGFGVSTNGESGASETRIEGDKDEKLTLSFDTAGGKSRHLTTRVLPFPRTGGEPGIRPNGWCDDRAYCASGGRFVGNVGPELDLFAANCSRPYLDTVLKGPPGNPLHLRARNPNAPELLLTDPASNHQANIYGDIADSMAAEMRAWLTQGGADWIARQPTVRASGASVPYPPAAVPDVSVPPARQFRVAATVVDRSSGEVTLTWNSENGFRYRIEASSDLGPWQVLAAGITAAGPGTSRTVADPALPGSVRRFYRVALVP
jgi:hypothetical protein